MTKVLDLANGAIIELPTAQAKSFVKNNPERFPALASTQGTSIQLIDAVKGRTLEVKLSDSRYFTGAQPDRYMTPDDLDWDNLKGDDLKIAQEAKKFNEGKKTKVVSPEIAAKDDEIEALKAQLAALQAAKKAAPKTVAKKVETSVKKKTTAKA